MILENEDIILDDNTVLDVKGDVVLYLYGSGKVTLNIGDNSMVTVYHVGVDICNNIVVNLNGDNSQILYNYDVVNYNNNKSSMTINHNYDNTISNVCNHGINVLDNVLDFNVTGVVLKDIKGSICNQENRIININDGKSTICPNLLIDSYDVVSSHAAYIGKFSDDVLFYLMSRGINKKKAYELLILSFLLPEGIDKEKIENFILEVKKI